jgi:hypothetical protein
MHNLEILNNLEAQLRLLEELLAALKLQSGIRLGERGGNEGGTSSSAATVTAL